ncbi:MAG: cofactor-independent phosphoglycerate mutase [Bacteroidaceae bacterium]|nr:cofactor-independent phosphoglycerate mutase [Bacteroidaceae bacterium]MBP5219630.1 cofactor-independent phosphoglycerate mutase [Bacteroidaceae bacterium]MBQ5352166.1 cofactor-independent phosphoglycerate mutase [Bacteroidaceae bacterium]MCR4700070.1 cofactor-independent phosphoglycerate mutase [Bacteroidaceae bacterium]
MKHIIILGDGMADWKVKELGDKTLLQYANTPYMDLLAKNGRVGRLKTVADGFHPGSEVANSSILGYDQSKVYEGRGPLEAASIGVELAPDDMAIRCNLICIENGNIKNHSCGRLETEEADVLIKFLQEKLGSERVHFYTGIQYRHLLVIKGGNKHLKCTPPHDVPGQPFMPLLVKPEIPEAKETADLINDLILKSQKLLADHPLNKQRVAEGKDPANSIWPWAGGYRPNMTPLTVTYPQIKRGAVITAVDLIRGIGRLAGLRCINVEGATGLYDTNYEGKAQAAIEALKTDDFVYLHVEASDEAGHDGNLKLKLQTIEDLDRRLIGPIYEAVKNFDEPVSIAVLPDHPTPVALRTHTNEPIPFLIYYPGIEADSVQTFDEIAAVDGSYGLFEGDGFINEFMNN